MNTKDGYRDGVYGSKTFLEAEESFLKAKRGEPTVEPIPNFTPRVREKDRPRKLRKFRPLVEARKALSKLSTVEYFKSILSDEVEKQLWMAFITGTAPKMNGIHPVRDEQGNIVMEEIELDPISWNAFRRAVEYKRGMPLVTVEDNTKGEARTVEVITIGANPKLFQQQAEAQGLLGIRKPDPANLSQNETKPEPLEGDV
jgi:hypothetical protein